MSDRPWPELAEGFPPEALRWHAVERGPAGDRVRLAPHLDPQALRERLDRLVGPEGWSLQLRSWGEERLVAELTVRGVSRAAVARACALPGLRGAEPAGSLDAGAAATGAAFTAAAAMFGVRAPATLHGDGWVDADPDGGEALHPPEHEVDPAPSPSAPTHTAAEPTGGPAKPDGHQVIDRLVERLREEGLGAEAARLVTAYGGYGRDADASRELYAKLRALLMERGARA